MLDKNSVIGIVGCGAMGTGIAQVAAVAGHQVIVSDTNSEALERSRKNLGSTLAKLAEKGKITAEQHQHALSSMQFVADTRELGRCNLVIEAIVEDLEVKKTLFRHLDSVTSEDCVLASNTSSLSVTSIAAATQHPDKVAGIHFFNPAAIMPLVEIVPGLATSSGTLHACKTLIASWGKTPVVAKDTPGFIVNRVARPFYSEALRIYEEGIASMATIDWAMREAGGFKMGPFELMDMIGHDVNYVVTETVWKQFYFDPRFRPSLTQKRLLEAGYLGRKSGKGFYDYSEGAPAPEPDKNKDLARGIMQRILCMLINEAADTLYLQIASREDIDLAMTRGVNYPKGLLKWADDFGVHNVVTELRTLYECYEEDRYRASPLLKRYAREKKNFYH